LADWTAWHAGACAAASVQAGLLASAAWHGRRGAAPTGCGVGAAALALCLGWRDGLPAVVLASHLALYLWLLAVFGASLRPGRIPVATRLATLLHGALTGRRAAYTRGVTWLWTGYFAVQLAASVALVLGKPVWVGPGVDVLLAAALFGAEFGVRSWCFRGEAHGGAADMVRLFRARGAAKSP
jgi:uncharacterized membrane protein